MDRFTTVKNEIEGEFQKIKAARISNLNSIEEVSLRNGFGKIPSIKRLLTKIDEECRDWREIGETAAVLRECRFLGLPKRTEISSAFLRRLSQIYEKFPNDEELAKCLENLVSIDEMNPLVIPQEIGEDASEAYKTVIYTLQDMSK